MKISICIITLNEEANLGRCLASCAGLGDEVVVLDSGSIDGTKRIAAEYGARWHEQSWLGYVGQKNLLLSLAGHDWVLSLDADEELSPELRQELLAVSRTEPPEDLSGFSVPRCVFYEGRWIRHGDWYPDRLVRLFRRDRAHFAGGKVHERLEITGHLEPLRGDLRHFSFRDAADHWTRCQKYARLWAETQHEAGKKAGPFAPLAHAVFRWLRAYIFRAGFMDGAAGARIALYAAREVYLKYQLLRRRATRPGGIL